MRWFNNGHVDSLMTLYREDACILPSACGKTNIHNYYQSAVAMGYVFKELNAISISVCDTITVEKGNWVIRYNSGEEIKGMYLTEWRCTNKKWLMVNEIANIQ